MSRESLKPVAKPTGKQIRKALIDLDITVLELAKAMQVTPYYIREIYAERRKAIMTRKKIARWIAEQYEKKGIKDVPRWAA